MINRPDDCQLNIKVAYFLVILLALVASFFAGLAYTGRQYIFWIFCFLAIFMICYGIFQKKSYGFLILCIFLWLGYCLKSVTHLLVNYPFREPMGYFSFTPFEWDEFYLIASMGMLVTIISAIFFLQFSRQSFLDRPSVALLGRGYEFSLRTLWVVGVVGAVVLFGVNYHFRIVSSGIYQPSIELGWIAKSAITWTISFGVPVAFCTLLDIDLRKNTRFVFKSILVLFIFLLLSISQSSRSVMVLSGLPIFVGLMVVYKKPIKKIFPILLIYFMFIILSVYGSNYRRYEHNQSSAMQSKIGLEINNRISDITANTVASITTDNITTRLSNLISNISALAVDRWIGLEGLASVVSYPNKSPELLLTSLIEKRVSGISDTYTLNVAQAFKDAPETSGAIAVQYASIAGLFGFLYLSNSLFLFCLGIFAIVGLIIFSEKAILSFTDNRMLALCWSTSFVFNLSSLTIGVPQVARYYLFSFIAVNILGFLLRKYYLIYENK